MTSTSWSRSGRIFYNASRIYYVPDEVSLPPLRWMAEKQQFEYLRSANSEDVELRASITELAQTCPQLYHLQYVQQQSIAASLSCYLPCEALYGVLPLGSANSVLIYVTEKEYVSSVCVGGATHDVYAVRGLQWLHLPCVTSSAVSQRHRLRREGRASRSRRGGLKLARKSVTEREGDAVGSRAAQPEEDESADGEDTEDDNDDDAASTSTEEGDDASEEEEEEEEVGRLPTKTVNDYLGVLNRFCEAINTQNSSGHRGKARGNSGEDEMDGELPGICGSANGFSYLYFSPTLDLSADPVHLLRLLTQTPHPSVSAHLPTGGGHHAWEDLRAAATTRQLYQWNLPLLSDGFALPTMTALQEELDILQGAKDKSAGGASCTDVPPVPWRGVCAEEVQRHARTPPGAPATPSLSSMALYVPSFIRGLVAQATASGASDMTLITRTCCRWAGTRYNRRGLEPGHSGVVANMSMTSLWVTSRQAAKDTTSPGRVSGTDTNSTPFAVYTVMRGSVPRRWEQPANLALKPSIKISPVGNAAEELGRHVRLLKQCLPEMHALFCMDTMSQSKLEEPLSEAFAAAVRRHVEGTPKTTSPTTSVVMEEKDGTHASAEDGGAAATSGGTAERDPSVTLVKFNVKKELKTHDYAEMMRRCLAELDVAAGSGAWLDFTRGHARCLSDDEEVRGGGSCGGGQEHTTMGGDDAAATAPLTSSLSRLSLDHVQSRLVRVNCLDCLDRTNLVQSILLCAALPRMIAYVDGTSAATSDTAMTTTTADCTDAALFNPAYAAASHRLRVLLAAQGTAISQLYAGTEPHFVPFMLNGHHHWSHKAVEGVLAQRRWYQQNFFDGVKQDGISLLTRQHNPQVFNADIESPFSRDLSGMNRQVMYGLLLGILPFLYSLMVCLSEHHYASSVFQLHFAICLGWVVYLSVLYNKLMRYRSTYTNRPLLMYTRQAEWC